MRRIVLLLTLFNCSLVFSMGNLKNWKLEADLLTVMDEKGEALQLKLCGPSVVRFWYSPNGMFERRTPSFAVVNEDLGEVGKINVDEYDNYLDFRTSSIRVCIHKNPIMVEVYDKYEKLILGDNKEGHRVSQQGISVTKILRGDEAFWGLGEKTGPMNRRGRTYRMWNSDRPCYGVNTDPLYKSIPFFISSYRYGVFFDNTYKTEFDLGKEQEDAYTFKTKGGNFIYYFFIGKDYKDLVSQYITLTGAPIMPPKWAFGLAQSRGTLTSERLTRSIAEGYRSRGIPCDMIFQDIGWTNGLQSFEWKPTRYTNPKKMLSDLKDMGFKVIVSQDPVISQKNEVQWKEADSLGYFVKDVRTGTSYNMPWPWGGNCGVVDFSKPGVADWWGAYQQKPLDDGVMGFWTDMGEPAWSNEESTDRLNMEHYLGMHDELHNVYGSIWDMAVTEQFEKRNPDRRIFQMTRSAFAGLQRYTFGWTGDAGNGSNMDAGWKQLENQIAIMLSSGLGGCVFSATDISGYCGKIENYPAMAELYIRWLQFGMFNTISRIHHEGDVAVEPWLFGEKAERIARKAIELKYRLIPYIYTYAREAYETGLPVLRPMFLEYPDDPETMEIESQFMFGENMLVAPVVRKGSSKKKVYLPVGNWIDYNTFEEYEGETWIDYQVSLDITPIFVKKGCIIPTHPVMNYVDEKENAPVIFEIYPEENDVECKFNLYEDDGISLGYKRNEFSRTMISAKWNDKKGIIRVHARESYLYTPVEERNFIFSILKSKKPKSISVDGKKLSKKEWNFNSVSGRCTVTIKDIGKQQDIELIY